MTSTNNNQLLWFSIYESSLGRKIITGVTGFGLSFFVIFHLLGNLLLIGDFQGYNQLAHWLENLRFLLYIIEVLLLFSGLLHVVIGIKIRLNLSQARPQAYEKIKSAGTPSKQSLSSRSMAITGIVIFGFLLWHLASFKFGTYYSTTVEGIEMRDLSRLVSEKFHNLFYVIGYTGAIALLGLHLRHGLWSAGQSLGLLQRQNSALIYRLASLVAFLVVVGFVIVPWTIYFS